MSTFDPNNLPAQPNPALQSNSAYAMTVTLPTGSVTIEPGDWAVLNPNLGFMDPVRKNLFQVSAVASDQIGVLYSSDGGNTYQSVNVSFYWVYYIFRLQTS